jgi:hypothetical protein
MIARRARPRFTVRTEVPRAGGLRAWGAVARAFEERLAAQAGLGDELDAVADWPEPGRDVVPMAAGARRDRDPVPSYRRSGWTTGEPRP